MVLRPHFDFIPGPWSLVLHMVSTWLANGWHTFGAPLVHCCLTVGERLVQGWHGWRMVGLGEVSVLPSNVHSQQQPGDITSVHPIKFQVGGLRRHVSVLTTWTASESEFLPHRFQYANYGKVELPLARATPSRLL